MKGNKQKMANISALPKHPPPPKRVISEDVRMSRLAVWVMKIVGCLIFTWFAYQYVDAIIAHDWRIAFWIASSSFFYNIGLSHH